VSWPPPGRQPTSPMGPWRELGLPCVVAATGATANLPDGALVEVDGSAGTVTVLEVPVPVNR